MKVMNKNDCRALRNMIEKRNSKFGESSICFINNTKVENSLSHTGTVKAVLTMRIRDASQSGAYTCNAVNGKGSDSQVGIITVFGMFKS